MSTFPPTPGVTEKASTPTTASTAARINSPLKNAPTYCRIYETRQFTIEKLASKTDFCALNSDNQPDTGFVGSPLGRCRRILRATEFREIRAR